MDTKKTKHKLTKEQKHVIYIISINIFLAVMFFLAALLWQSRFDMMGYINACFVSGSIMFFIGWMVLMANKNILSPFIYGIKAFGLMFKGSKPKEDYYTYTQRIKDNPYPNFMYYIPMIIAAPLIIAGIIMWIVYDKTKTTALILEILSNFS